MLAGLETVSTPKRLAPRRVAWMSVLLCASWNASLHGDEPLVEGARIRVEARGNQFEGPVTGTLLRLEAGNLTLRLADLLDPVALPAHQVAKVEVSEGRGRRRAAGIGALVGLGVAGILTFAASQGGGESLCGGSGCVTLFAILSTPCAGIGAAVGAAVAPEQWREVPLPGRSARDDRRPLAIGIAPVPGGGAQLRMHWSF